MCAVVTQSPFSIPCMRADGDETASTGARPVAYSESFPSSTSSAAAVEQDASFLLLGVRTQPVAKEDGITARLKSWLKKSSKK